MSNGSVFEITTDDFAFYLDDGSSQPVPEPSTLGLIGLGLVGSVR